MGLAESPRGHSRRPLTRSAYLGLLLALAAPACAEKLPEPTDGARVAVTVAPLRLPGLSDVDYTLTLTNAAGATVWSTAVASSRYGDGRGAISYVGPCDASSNPNTVAVVIDRLVDDDGETVPRTTWRDPSPVTRPIVCVANTDVPAAFDITVLRDAQQGFFDVAVEFDDIFCSAKLDCQDVLLHVPGGERGPTAVVALACAAGSGQPTWLYFADDLALTCGDRTYFIDPTGGPGNLGGQPPALFQAATYRGREGFPNAEKCYWNLALGVDPTAAPCTLTARATASSTPFVDGQLPPGSTWPEIVWDAVPIQASGDTLACGSHPLDGPDSRVHTGYIHAGEGRFRHQLTCATGDVATLGAFDCAVEGALCDAGDPCAIGTCTAGACVATGQQPDGALCADEDACDPLASCVTACAQGACEGARPSRALNDVPVEPDASITAAAEDSRDHAYLAKRARGVESLDITDPAQPASLATWTEPDVDCTEVATLELDASVFVAASCGDAGVKLIDFTDPAAPALASTITTTHPATTLALIDAWLYVADGPDVRIYDASDPTNPVAFTPASVGGAGAIFKLRASADRVYCLLDSGRLIVSDATQRSVLTQLNALEGYPGPTALAVQDDVAYCTYDGAGFYIVDLHGANVTSPALLYHDGGSRALHVAVHGYRGALVYADGRYVTLSFRRLSRPRVLTSSFAPSLPTGVAIFRAGYGLCPYGARYSILDFLPFLVGASPPDGTTGLCAGDPLELRFSEPLDPSCVSDDAVAVKTADAPVPGAVTQPAPASLRYAPAADFVTGPYRARAESACDLRANPGPLVPDEVTFDVAAVCVATPDFRDEALGGQPVRFTWALPGATVDATSLTVSVDVQGVNPYATHWIVTGVASVGGGYEATWTPPIVTIPTTFWVVVAADVAGVTRHGQVLPIRVLPDPDACADGCPPSAGAILYEDPRATASGDVYDAIEDAGDPDVAYVALGADGLEVRDQTDPTDLKVIGAWDDLDPTLDCVALAQLGDVVYLACGVAGVKCINVADPTTPTWFGTLVTGPATTLAMLGHALYVGVGDRVRIYDLTDPLAPVFVGYLGGDNGQGPGALVRVVVDGTNVYCLFADGTIIVSSAALDVLAPTFVRVIAAPSAGLVATDLAVADGLGYCAYRGAGLYIVDLRGVLAVGPFTPAVLWHDGGSDIVRVSVVGRTFACLYTDGRTILSSAKIPTAPTVLSVTAGSGLATGLRLLPRWAFCGLGAVLRVLDVPPFVVASSHREDTRGVCADAPLDLWFSSPLEASTVNADTLDVDGLPGARTVDAERARFTPDAPFEPGAHPVRARQQQITNVRGTAGPTLDYTARFEVADICVDWTQVPDAVLGGAPVELSWDASGAVPDATFVHLSAYPDPGDPFAPTTSIAGAASALGYTATWQSPKVATTTTWYAVAEARVGGVSYWSPIARVTVQPVLDNGATLAGAAILDAVDDGDLAYVAIGQGLEVHDVSTPDAPVVLGRWLDPALGSCQAVAARAPYVYLACGASGVYVLDVSTPATPTSVFRIEQPGTTTLALYGDALYLGFGEDVAIWDVRNPRGPLYVRTIVSGSGSPLIRVLVADGLLYCWFANGTFVVSDLLADAFSPVFIRLVASLYPGRAGVDLRVVSGVAYLAYGGGIGLVAVDVRDIRLQTWVAVVLWVLAPPDAGANIVRFYVRNGLVTCLYSNGRFIIGALGLTLTTAPTILVSTLRSGTPSAVVIFASGYVLCAYGRAWSYVDPPLYLVASVPTDGGATCGDSAVDLWFSAPVRPESVHPLSLAVTRDGDPVDGTWQVSGGLARFTASAPMEAGAHEIVVGAALENVRGTRAVPASRGFDVGAACLEVTAQPLRVVAGDAARFAWTVHGPAASTERVHISTSSTPATAPLATVTGSGGATWTTPRVAVATTYYAQVEAVVGATTLRSEILRFVVEPPLATLQAGPGESLLAVAEGEDDLAYVATGLGLTIRSLADPDAPIELGRWTLSGLSGCDALAVSGTTVYLSCGAAGLHIIDCADPLAPALAGTLDVDVVSLVIVGNALYLGLAGGDILVYDLTSPFAPVYVTTVVGAALPLVRLMVDGFILYCLYADGTVGRIDLTTLFAPVVLTAIAPYITGVAVDFTVIGGIAYIGFASGGVTIVDVRGAAVLLGTVIPPAGAGLLVGFSVRHGVLAAIYANGGFATYHVVDPGRIYLLGYTIGAGTPTFVHIFRSGYAFWSVGTAVHLVDLPPVLVLAFPDGGAACPTAALTLRFSAALDPSSVTAESVRVTRAGLPVAVTRAVAGAVVTLTPASAFQGDVTVTVGAVVNSRGTPSSEQAETRTFTFSPVCLSWVSTPTSLASGLGAAFIFTASGGAFSDGEIVIGPLDAPRATWVAAAATPSGGSHSLAWTAPDVSVATTYAAFPRVATASGPAVGPLATFTVVPEPCSLTPLCDDGNDCTDETCVEYVGCVATPNDGNTCDDESLCTSGDHCDDGLCVPATTTTCSPGTCEVAWCDPSTGACDTSTASDGALCDDADPDTGASVCADGVCEPVAAGTTVGTLDLGPTYATSVIRRVVQIGVYAYVVLEYGGLVILDVSDPQSPVTVGGWSLTGRDGCTNLVVDGDRAYLVCSGEVHTISVADRSAPQLLDSVAVVGVTSIVLEGGYLYLGSGSNLWVYALGVSGLPVFSGTWDLGYGPIVRVWYANGYLYTVSSGGTIRVLDVRYGAVTPVYTWHTWTWIDGPWQVTDLVIVGGYVYVSYAGGGVYAFDVSNPSSPIVTWWSGPGHVTSLGYAGGILVYGYADGGVVTASVADPGHPVTLSWTYASTAVSAAHVLVSNGSPTAFVAAGAHATILDVPPYVVSMSPYPGSTGLCAQGPIDLWFSTALDATSVTADTFIVETLDGVAVTGQRTVNQGRVTFTPAADAMPAGAYRVRVTDAIRNTRGTPGAAGGFTAELTIAAACVRWTTAPSGVEKGATGLFGWEVVGATATSAELLLSTHADPLAPIANPIILAATPSGAGFTVSWSPPEMARNTVYYALPRVASGGDVVLGQVLSFVVIVEGCFCEAGERCEGGLCVPAPTCEPGFGNCDHVNGNGCETVIDGDDVNHCGGCGVRCGGGVCEDGQCLPTAIVTNAGGEVFGLDVDETHVYWAARSSYQLRRAEKDGANPEIIASGHYVNDVVVDDTHAWFTTYLTGQLLRVPKAGGAVVVVAHGLTTPVGVTKQGQRLYFTSWSDGTVRRLSLLTGAHTPVATAPDSALGGLAVDGDALFATGNGGGLFALPLAGGAAQTLASPGAGLIFADADDRYVYYAGTNRLGRVDRASGAVEAFSTTGLTYGVAVDDRFIYWSNASSATINRLAKPIEAGGTNLVCRADRGDCNADPSDDCEVDTDDDRAHCGACGAACAPGEVCDGGTCGPLVCAPERDDCDGDVTNGCEADLRNGPTTCGGCGVTCDSGACMAGDCVPDVVSHSCLGHQSDGRTTSGYYLVDPDGPGALAPVAVYCDQDTDGGGWTVVARASDTNGLAGDYEFRAAAGERSLLGTTATVGLADAPQYSQALDELWADASSPLSVQYHCYDRRDPDATSYWAKVVALDYAPLAAALDEGNPDAAFTSLAAVNKDGVTTAFGRLDVFRRGTSGTNVCGNGAGGQSGVKLACMHGQQPMSPRGVWMMTHHTGTYTEVTSCGNIGGSALPHYAGEVRLREHACADGHRNADESDVDCGGTVCAPCDAGDTCVSAADCDSLVCSVGVCQAPTCTDGVANGDETGVDCGGSCGDLCNGVTWKNLVSVTAVYTAAGAGLDRTTGGDAWNAGASSIQTVPGDGYLSFVAEETTAYRMIGLSNGDSNASYTDIDFAWYLAIGNGLTIYEGGVSLGGFGGYNTGDTFRVEVMSGQVRYVHNGVIRYTSSRAPTFPLGVDTSVYSAHATVRGALLTSCATVPDDPICVFGRTWRQVANVSGDGDTLVRAEVNAGWTAGASSEQRFTCGKGRLSVTATETDTERVIGLGDLDTSLSNVDVDYGLHFRADGTLVVAERGVNRGTFGTYQTGEVYAVEMDVPVVRYLKNGAVFYTSTVPASLLGTWVVDAALFTPGATLDGIALTDLDTTGDPTCGGDAFWKNDNATVRANGAKKSTGTANWDQGASTVQTIASGDGFAELTVGETGTSLMAGLGDNDTTRSYTDIDFAFYFASGTLNIYESSSSQGSFGGYLADDRVRVEVRAGQVHYYRNDVHFYTSAVPPTYPLALDTSFATVDGTVNDVVIHTCGVDDPLCTRALDWQNGRHLTATETSIRRDIGAGWGTAGASTRETISCGNGRVSGVVTGLAELMFGLGAGDTSMHYNDIEYAFYTIPDGTLQIYESGNLRSTVGTYGIGDELTVEIDMTGVDAPVVRYLQNDVLVYTSGVPPHIIDRFRLDTAIASLGGELVNLVLVDDDGAVDPTCGGASFWTDIAGATARDTGVRREVGGNDYNAGAISQAELTGDGYMEATVPTTAHTLAVGLGSGNASTSYTDIDFGIYLAGPTIYVYESGVSRGSFGTFVAGARFRVEVIDGVVNYLRDGVIFYTSPLTPSFPLVVDTSLYSNGATLTDVVITPCLDGDTTCAPALSWYGGAYITARDGGATLVADISVTSWSSGAASVQTIACARGSASATATRTDKELMFGLGVGNSSAGYGDIEHAIYLNASGVVGVYESGASRGSFGAYIAGDVFTVEVDAPTVRYLKNGVAFYTSTLEASAGEDYRLDTAFGSQNASLAGLTLTDLDAGGDPSCGASAFWTAIVGAVAKDNHLRKDVGGAAYNAGAVSLATLSGDGYMEFTVPTNAPTLAAGLGTGDAGTSYTDIEHGVYLAGPTIYVYENATSRGSFSTFAAGARFRVEVVDGVVRYLRDGVGFYTSALTPSFPLGVDTSLHSEGARLRDVTIASCDGDASCAPALRWQNGRQIRAIGETTLVRDASAGWTSGASTERTLLCGRGKARAVASETTTERMFGLGVADTTPSYTDIRYAFYLRANGGLSVYESGAHRGDFGTYATGDILDVEIDAPAVMYRKNGQLLYTSTVSAAITDDHRLDTSLNTAGATFTGLSLLDADDGGDPTCGGDAFWTASPGALIRSTSVVKTSADGWTAGAVTRATFTGDGYVETVPRETNRTRAVGLGTAAEVTHVNHMAYALQLNSGGTITIVENGTSRGNFATYATGDVLRVERIGATVRYLRNGVGLYTSTVPSASTDALAGQVALFHNSATVQDLRVTACLAGDDSCTPPLRWMNGRYVSGTPSSLVRDASGTVWASGAISEEAIHCGAGFVETTVTAVTGHRMFGLGRGDTNQSYTDIDYAFYLAGGSLQIFETTSNRGTFGTYAVGDELIVEVDVPLVRYWHTTSTGTSLVYTSTVPATLLDTFRLDTSFNEADSRLDGLALDPGLETDPTCGGAAFWKNANTTIKGNSVLKDSGVANVWDRGASTWAQIASGDGYLELTPGDATTTRIVGLATDDADESPADIDFGIQLGANGLASVYESGVLRASLGGYTASDRFRVAVTGGVVTYHRGGVLLYTSAVAPTYPLEGDVSLYTMGARVLDVELVSIDPTLCGNGEADPGETCDDDGVDPGDGCGATCLVEQGYACEGFPSECTLYTVLPSCKEALLAGYTTSGVYPIDPDGAGGGPSFEVWCDQTTDGGGWTVFQRRVSSSDFYLDWASYAAGFGDAATNYWLGNDRVADFTARFPSELRVDLTYGGVNRFAFYSTFAMAAAGDNYRLAIGTYSGDAGDSLANHNGARFSTRDRDNDGNGGSCAVSYVGAWWYTSCHHSNLNGVWGSSTYGQGVNWYALTGHTASATFSEMKMRER